MSSKRNRVTSSRHASEKKQTNNIDESDNEKKLICSVPVGIYICSLPQIDITNLEQYVKVICTSKICNQSTWMHDTCFRKFEDHMVNQLSRHGRGRGWTQYMCQQNVWQQKGFEIVYKWCACNCGKGTIKKDIHFYQQQVQSSNSANQKKARKKKCDKPNLYHPTHSFALNLKLKSSNTKQKNKCQSKPDTRESSLSSKEKQHHIPGLEAQAPAKNMSSKSKVESSKLSDNRQQLRVDAPAFTPFIVGAENIREEEEVGEGGEWCLVSKAKPRAPQPEDTYSETSDTNLTWHSHKSDELFGSCSSNYMSAESNFSTSTQDSDKEISGFDVMPWNLCSSTTNTLIAAEQGDQTVIYKSGDDQETAKESLEENDDVASVFYSDSDVESEKDDEDLMRKSSTYDNPVTKDANQQLADENTEIDEKQGEWITQTSTKKKKIRELRMQPIDDQPKLCTSKQGTRDINNQISCIYCRTKSRSVLEFTRHCKTPLHKENEFMYNEMLKADSDDKGARKDGEIVAAKGDAVNIYTHTTPRHVIPPTRKKLDNIPPAKLTPKLLQPAVRTGYKDGSPDIATNPSDFISAGALEQKTSVFEKYQNYTNYTASNHAEAVPTLAAEVNSTTPYAKAFTKQGAEVYLPILPAKKASTTKLSEDSNVFSHHANLTTFKKPQSIATGMVAPADNRANGSTSSAIKALIPPTQQEGRNDLTDILVLLSQHFKVDIGTLNREAEAYRRKMGTAHSLGTIKLLLKDLISSHNSEVER